MEFATRIKISSSLKVSKLVGKKHTDKIKSLLSSIAKNRKKDPKKGISVAVMDTITGKINLYKSIREVSRFLKADTRSIRSRIINEKRELLKFRSPLNPFLFRGRYLIKLIKTNEK